nr:hypothetical protein [Tanacetum cinerariifolium]
MKEIRHQCMFKTGTYKSLPEHVALYEALEASMKRTNIDELLTEIGKSRKRRRDDQDPPPPLPDLDLNIRRRHDTDASGLSHPQAPQSPAWKKSNTQDAPLSSSKQQSSPHAEQPVEDLPMPETANISDSEDTDSAYLPKIKQKPEWLKPILDDKRLATPEPAWVIPSSHIPSAMGKTELTQADFEGQAYEVVKAFYPNVIHLQFQMKECHKMLTYQIDWTNLDGDQVRIDISKPLPLSGPPVRTHMRILSVVSIKAFSRYGYDYLKDITLRIADYQEYTITEKDFKSLYPSDFEDLNMLLLQVHLNHLYGSDKRMLSIAVKLWTRNLVIRQRVEDFQLGIESYKKQLNLTKPRWDAKGFEYKHDYTIIDSHRAVVFPVSNNELKITRFNDIYKFSDGMLTNILEALDFKFTEYKVNWLNPGMNTWFWTDKGVARRKEFIHAIEQRLKTRRIFQNLECFVGGRVRDIDCRLLQRTE